MKRLISLLLAGIAALAMMVSCDQPQPQPENEGWKPEGPGMENHPEFPAFADFPITCSSLYAEENEAGVTIEVKGIYDDNFVFELRPGALVQSRRYERILDSISSSSDPAIPSSRR